MDSSTRSGEEEVLVVEDDDDIRDGVTHLLESEGYRVAQAPHGQAAMDLLARGLRPGVVLLDMMMPVMNGWEFLIRLRQCPALCDIPVVVVSASRPRVSAAAILDKPFEANHLLALVRRFCGASICAR
jgi:CheY-like chemotaxis protein